MRGPDSVLIYPPCTHPTRAHACTHDSDRTPFPVHSEGSGYQSNLQQCLGGRLSWFVSFLLRSRSPLMGFVFVSRVPPIIRDTFFSAPRLPFLALAPSACSLSCLQDDVCWPLPSPALLCVRCYFYTGGRAHTAADSPRAFLFSHHPRLRRSVRTWAVLPRIS